MTLEEKIKKSEAKILKFEIALEEKTKQLADTKKCIKALERKISEEKEAIHRLNIESVLALMKNRGISSEAVKKAIIDNKITAENDVGAASVSPAKSGMEETQ